MLSIGLTGGIAAGKSLLAARFKELGALLIDADQLARDVVAPGTPGLAAIVERFGTELLLPDGSLDRPALGALVFAEPESRSALNNIVHPLVRTAAKELQDGAGAGDIVVQDIPLLAESGQGTNFHLVIVVQAPEAFRIARMVADRGMNEADARARMAAQATDEQRAAVADVLIVNDGEPAHVLAELDRLWHDRLVPFAVNLANNVPAALDETGQGTRKRTRPAQLARIKARLSAAVRQTSAAGDRAVVVELAGGTTGSGQTIGGVPEFVIRVSDRADLEDIASALSDAGYPRVRGSAEDGSAEGWPVHASADPGCPVTVQLQVTQ